jgi:hypothetical protein
MPADWTRWLGGDSGLIDTAGYAARCEAAAELLGNAVGSSGEGERLRALRQRLEHRSNDIGDPLAFMRRELRTVLPAAYEFVLVYRDGAPRGYAILTQGAYGASLPERTRLLFEIAVRAYLDGGGDVRAAELLADVFRAAFPDPSVLSAYDAAAQALVIAFVPRRRGLELKAYVNTRLAPGNHRDRVRSVLAAAGTAPADYDALYDALYDEARGARFVGVGLDVEAAPARRAKLYVRTPVDGLAAHAAALPLSDGGLVESSLALVDRRLLADDAELAVALRSDGTRSLKLTLFFSPRLEGEAAVSAAAAAMAHLRCDATALRAVCAALACASPATGVRQPLHGLGFESGTAAKLNVYLQPPA